jgi:predicted kinase
MMVDVSLRLIVVSGLPGVGKSAVAALAAEGLGAVHLSIDPVEEALLGAGLEPGWTTGVAAYEAVRAAAETNLVLGHTVVVDAVNDSDGARDTWRVAASRTGAEVCWIVLICSDPVEHARRLADRRRGLALVPEPSWDDVRARREGYEPWTDPHTEIDTAGTSPSEVADEVIESARTPM